MVCQFEAVIELWALWTKPLVDARSMVHEIHVADRLLQLSLCQVSTNCVPCRLGFWIAAFPRSASTAVAPAMPRESCGTGGGRCGVVFLIPPPCHPIFIQSLVEVAVVVLDLVRCQILLSVANLVPE
eukprot:1518257-Amphidinium_carterae.2